MQKDVDRVNYLPTIEGVHQTNQEPQMSLNHTSKNAEDVKVGDYVRTGYPTDNYLEVTKVKVFEGKVYIAYKWGQHRDCLTFNVGENVPIAEPL